MHCKACDKLLSDSEAKKRDKISGHYLDLCYECLDVSNKTLYDMQQDDEEGGWNSPDYEDIFKYI